MRKLRLKTAQISSLEEAEAEIQRLVKRYADSINQLLSTHGLGGSGGATTARGRLGSKGGMDTICEEGEHFGSIFTVVGSCG